MATSDFPGTIWNGHSADRKGQMNRRPSAADWEQAVAEIQALQVQLKNALEKLNVIPVPNLSYEEILAEADKRYAPIDAPVMRYPLPRVPNTFISIDANGIGQPVSYQAMLDWIMTEADKRYKPINYTVTIPIPLSIEQIVVETDKKYLPKTYVPPVGFTQAQADARYLPINTVIPTQGMTVVEADAKYLPKTTVIPQPLTLAAITLETDKRYLLQAPPLTTVASIVSALDKKKDK